MDYLSRRAEIETYFDRTAAAAWARLTSDAPLGRIRASVRAGRDAMRDTLLAALPADMQGQRLLDAGCGTGALALAAARRGAEVLAIDLSPTLISLARERADAEPDGARLAQRIHWASGDMSAAQLGDFDHVVAMDSLIHYGPEDVIALLAAWAPRTRVSLHFTLAPHTRLLGVMHAVGRLFPRGNRAPAIHPQRLDALQPRLQQALPGWTPQPRQRIASGFYTSEACTWRRA